MPIRNIDAFQPFRLRYHADLLAYIEPMLTKRRLAQINHRIKLRTRHICMVAETLHDEHNIHAMIRSSECFGWQDFYNVSFDGILKKNRSVTKGAFQWTHIYNYSPEEGIESCISDLKKKGYQVWATSCHTSDSYTPHTLPLDQPAAVIMGSEHNGISDTALRLADGILTIPMYGFTESFNVSVASAIVGYTLNSRLRQMDINFALSPEEQRDLYFEWLWYNIRNPQLIYNQWLDTQNQLNIK